MLLRKALILSVTTLSVSIFASSALAKGSGGAGGNFVKPNTDINLGDPDDPQTPPGAYPPIRLPNEYDPNPDPNEGYRPTKSPFDK